MSKPQHCDIIGIISIRILVLINELEMQLRNSFFVFPVCHAFKGILDADMIVQHLKVTAKMTGNETDPDLGE